MFANDTAFAELEKFINGWQVDGLATRGAFIDLKEFLVKIDKSLISFHARPGITCSLRAHIAVGHGEEGPLCAMVDVIDDDPAQRWLSVCFFANRISDPDASGDFVPGGLLGQDAVCFDYDAGDAELLEYIKKRIAESYQASLSLASA
jgi:hypothetical protein